MTTPDMSAPPESFAGYVDEYLPDDMQSATWESVDLWPRADDQPIVTLDDFSLS